ncbi:YkgJ family cysteine cluster protein [Oceaniglobus trochenteri]|uniref:YkgJ family cysteine cluster protein n=1 Tax=Oceaniglobus trochenteri TaxID=2763260 RepID=UPI001CFF8850
MTTTPDPAAIRALIPSFSCKTDCHDCCGIVPFSDVEKQDAMKVWPLEQWERFGGKNWVARRALETGDCPFLRQGKCSIYETRPTVCRLFGATDHPLMKCPHGCGPKRKISEIKSRAILKSMEAEARHE